jgi:hypothetical protein
MKLPLISAIDVLATTLFFYLLSTFRDQRRRRGLPYPPGPPPLPIIGNLLDIPKESPWAKYASISKQYGTANILVTPFRRHSHLHEQAMCFAFEFSDISLWC